MELVNNLTRHGILKTERVINAFLSVDRADFVRLPTDAYMDAPSSIGHAATISAPHMHGYAVEALEGALLPGSKVLDVGSGSGYLLPVFSRLVGPSGLVVGVEHIPQLVEWSEDNVRKHNADLLDSGRVILRVGDGFEGHKPAGPYDVIHVGAAAPELPPALLAQLKMGGEIVCPVGAFSQQLVKGTRVREASGGDSGVEVKHLMGVMYVPLTQAQKQDPNNPLLWGPGQPSQVVRAEAERNRESPGIWPNFPR